METRKIVTWWALSLSLSLLACGKPQNSVPSKSLQVVPSAPAVAAASAVSPSASTQTIPKFTAEVLRGQQFERIVAPNMVFRLEPYAGNDSGWTIRIAPGTDSAASEMDCIGAIQVPLHGDTTLQIEPPEDGDSKDPSWKQREFDFVATPKDCKVAWDSMTDANYNPTLSEKERDQASARSEKLLLRHGTLTILDVRYGPANATNAHGTLEWLKFEVDLNAGGPAASAPAPSTPTPTSSIRAIDPRPFIESHLGQLNPDLADLDAACGDGQKPLQGIAPVLYGDLDGDGQEEAAVQGFSCLAGNGGADFRGILKLLPSGKLSVLPTEPLPKKFKGRDVLADLRGHMVIEIKGAACTRLTRSTKARSPIAVPKVASADLFIAGMDTNSFSMTS